VVVGAEFHNSPRASCWGIVSLSQNLKAMNAMGCSYYPVGTCATNRNSFGLCWGTIKSQHQYANSIATNADCALA